MREFLYNSVTECVINMKLVILTKTCLSETYTRVCVGKHLFVVYTISDSLNIGDVLLSLLYKFPL